VRFILSVLMKQNCRQFRLFAVKATAIA